MELVKDLSFLNKERVEEEALEKEAKLFHEKFIYPLFLLMRKMKEFKATFMCEIFHHEVECGNAYSGSIVKVYDYFKMGHFYLCYYEDENVEEIIIKEIPNSKLKRIVTKKINFKNAFYFRERNHLYGEEKNIISSEEKRMLFDDFINCLNYELDKIKGFQQI